MRSMKAVEAAPDPVLELPPEQIGPALAAVPEGQWFDRKSIRTQPQHLAHTEVAFANAEGGTIVVGIHDGRVEGTDAQPQHRNELMQAAIDHTEPPVYDSDVDRKTGQASVHIAIESDRAVGPYVIEAAPLPRKGERAVAVRFTLTSR